MPWYLQGLYHTRARGILRGLPSLACTPVGTNVRRSLGCLVAFASIAAGLLWPALSRGATPPSPAPGADTLATIPGARPLAKAPFGETLAPVSLSEQAGLLVAGSVADWSQHELEGGQLIDPVLGVSVGSYGTGMIGQVMVEVGASRGSLEGRSRFPDEALIADGLRAEVSETVSPDDSAFELLALSDAFIWNEHNLSKNLAWQAARPAIAAFLSVHGPIVSSGTELCNVDPGCYDNHKLVAGVAALALLATGLDGAAPTSLLHDRAALRRRALDLLAQATVNTGSGARRIGKGVSFTGAGILSDPTRNPLAYQALSSMMLGDGVEALGEAAPASARDAFLRSARGLVGLMAPDGNTAYIGRGQGEVWTVAATADALSIAASMTHSALWRGRYLVAAALALRRLQTVYPLASRGLAMVPRLAEEASEGTGTGEESYEGIDGYANTVESDGLALWALAEATRVLFSLPVTRAQLLPSASNGVFLDPSQTKFAAVTDGSLWYAIHATDSDPADARYDFGLVAAERRTGIGWEPILPYRPLTSTPTTGGPALLLGGQELFPVGRTISAAADGEVVVKGGWETSSEAAPSRLDAVWRFRPTPGASGVALSFSARAGQSYQFEVWYARGSHLTESASGLSVQEPGGYGCSYTLNGAVGLTFVGEAYHSAYDAQLESALITVRARGRHPLISYTTTFLSP